MIPEPFQKQGAPGPLICWEPRLQRTSGVVAPETWFGQKALQDLLREEVGSEQRGRLGGDLEWDRKPVFVPFCFTICNFLSPHKPSQTPHISLRCYKVRFNSVMCETAESCLKVDVHLEQSLPWDRASPEDTPPPAVRWVSY